MVKIFKKQYAIYVFVILCNLLLLLFIGFSLYTLNTYNLHRYKLTNYVSNIDKANLVAFYLNNGQTMNLEKMKKSFPEAITELSKLENSLENEKIDASYKPVFNNLKLGLKNNILIYRELLSILNNLDSPDILNSMETVLSYEKNCNYFYSNIKSKDKYFSLPVENVNNINSTYNYLEELSQSKKNAAIANTQKLEFGNNMTTILENFNSIKVNLNYYVESSRKKVISYDTAISKVQKNKDELNNLLVLFSSMNVPADGVTIYSSFKDILSAYNTYIDTFSSALTKEKSEMSNSNNVSNTSTLFTEANKKFNTLNDEYNNFKEAFNNYSNK